MSQPLCISVVWKEEPSLVQEAASLPAFRYLPTATPLLLGQALASRALLTPAPMSRPFHVHVGQQFHVVIGYRAYKYPEGRQRFLALLGVSASSHGSQLICLHPAAPEPAGILGGSVHGAVTEGT